MVRIAGILDPNILVLKHGLLDECSTAAGIYSAPV